MTYKSVYLPRTGWSVFEYMLYKTSTRKTVKPIPIRKTTLTTTTRLGFFFFVFRFESHSQPKKNNPINQKHHPQTGKTKKKTRTQDVVRVCMYSMISYILGTWYAYLRISAELTTHYSLYPIITTVCGRFSRLALELWRKSVRSGQLLQTCPNEMMPFERGRP